MKISSTKIPKAPQTRRRPRAAVGAALEAVSSPPAAAAPVRRFPRSRTSFILPASSPSSTHDQGLQRGRGGARHPARGMGRGGRGGRGGHNAPQEPETDGAPPLPRGRDGRGARGGRADAGRGGRQQGASTWTREDLIGERRLSRPRTPQLRARADRTCRGYRGHLGAPCWPGRVRGSDERLQPARASGTPGTHVRPGQEQVHRAGQVQEAHRRPLVPHPGEDGEETEPCNRRHVRHGRSRRRGGRRVRRRRRGGRRG